jgi:hypothetical protein
MGVFAAFSHLPRSAIRRKLPSHWSNISGDLQISEVAASLTANKVFDPVRGAGPVAGIRGGAFPPRLDARHPDGRLRLRFAGNRVCRVRGSGPWKFDCPLAAGAGQANSCHWTAQQLKEQKLTLCGQKKSFFA